MVIKSFLKILALLASGMFLALIFPRASSAANLSLTANQSEFKRGDVFAVEVRLDTESENINAIETHITFPRDMFEPVEVEVQQSIITMWAYEPIASHETGSVSFVGGLPNPGFTGQHGLVGKILLQAKATGQATITVAQASQVLKNDGLGTPVPLSENNLLLNISEPPPGYVPIEPPVIVDTTPPTNLTITVSRSDTEFEGKYFAVFQAQDRESGISHYEIAELPLSKPVDLSRSYPQPQDWKPAKSPYVLEHQSGVIGVFAKAVDKQGNQSVASTVADARGQRFWSNKYSIILVFLLILVLLAIIHKNYFRRSKPI